MQPEVTATVFFFMLLSLCCTEKCGLHVSAGMKNRSVTLRNTDTKLCQSECTEDSFIFASCRKLSIESNKTRDSSNPPKNRTHRPGSPCPSNDCNQTSQCLDTGCRNACEQPMLTPGPQDGQAEDKLHQACKTGNLCAVQIILCQSRVDINCKQSGWTPPRKGHLELMKLLVNKGAKTSLAKACGNNILHLACANGPLDVVQYVLSLDVVDINSRGWKKRTPVMLAGLTGRLNIVSFLVSKGGDVSLIDEESNNIVHHACESGQAQVVHYVLSMGVVDINSRGWRLKTPVMLAAEAGYSELVGMLLKKEANVSLVDAGGDNLLHLTCAMGNVEVVRYVLSEDLIDIDSRGHDWKTQVMLAAEEGLRGLVELFVKKGAHVLLVDTDGNNVLHLVCENEYVQVAHYILSQHLVNIDAKNSK